MRAGKLSGLVVLAAVMLGHGCGARASAPSARGSFEAGGKAPDNRGAGAKVYTAPDGAFSIKLPPGWRVRREVGDGAYVTTFTSDEYRAANLTIMTIDVPTAETDSADLQDYRLTESSKVFFQGWLEGLMEQARVEERSDVYRTRVDGLPALQLDVTYYRGDKDDQRKGYSLYLSGRKTTFCIGLTGDRAGFDELKKVIATLDIEP